ncbi:MAG: sigma-70 family RNA polymerase sigma factor [Candidatus Hodgkinia cicadicola]
MINRDLYKQVLKLQNKVRCVQFASIVAILRLPLAKNMLLALIEELWAGGINVFELFDKHSNVNIHSPHWVSEICAPFANTYSREWFYINLYYKKSPVKFYSRFWKCNCKICKIARLLLKTLFMKQTREVEWAQVGLLLRLGISHPFVQLLKLITSIASESELILKLKCIRPSVYAIKVNSAINALRALDESKNELVAASVEPAEQIAKIYTKQTSLTPAVINATKEGLSKAVNRFDFNSTAKFASYSKWWIKKEIMNLFKPQKPRKKKKVKQQRRNFNLSEIGLTGLLKLAKGSNEPPVVPQDSKTKANNTFNVLAALSLLKPREEWIIRQRCSRPQKSLKAIGSHFYLSRERVRQLLVKIIKSLERYNSMLIESGREVYGPPEGFI